MMTTLLGFSLGVKAQSSSGEAQQPQVGIAPFYGGRQAALSLTFDDGLMDQYTLAFPELKHRGLKATFAIIGSKVGGVMRSKQDRRDGTEGTPCMSWNQLREMAADGQEIASHGWEHRAVTRLSDDELTQELCKNDSAIETEIGQRPLTFVYPGNSQSAETVARCEQGRVGSRTFQMSLGSKRTTPFLREYIDDLISKGEWGVTMTHGILQGYDHFQNPQVLWNFLDDVCARQDQLWVAPLRDVTAYVKEREAAILSVESVAQGLLVGIRTGLDAKLFRHQLTLAVKTSIASAEQDGVKLSVSRRNGVAYVNVNPNGGKVLLRTKMIPSHLTVEGRENPMGLDEQCPRLGWQIDTDKNNVVQTGYRIQIATLKDARAVVWDSGDVKSDQSQWVATTHQPTPNTQYFWRVKVTTNKGDSDWSDWNHWSTGLFSEQNWQGQWIGYDSLTADVRMERHSRIAARHLRKSFALTKPVKRATAHICGLGYYILNVNGQRIGDYLLAPAPTQYNKAVCYDTYDVTRVLSAFGTETSIDVVLGGGYFFPMTQNYQTNVRTAFGMPKLRLNLIVEYEDGTSETIATDSTWQVAVDGPIRYANLYDGTLIDYRMTPTEWMPVQVVEAPCQPMRGGLLSGVKAYAEERPVNISKAGDRRFILDFGTNNTGRICLPKVTIAPGDTVCVRYAETLKDNGKELYTANLRSAENTDYFVGNGSPVTMTTEFLWHGFRYMEVTGLDEQDVRRLQRQLMTDDLLSSAAISIDEGDGMINRILANARRGILSNYKGMPMDCPQRDERMPWLGDRTMGCFGESYLANNHTLYSKWLQDICDAQRADGNISDVCPAYWRLYNGNITWPAALPFGLEMLRLQYGDERPWQKMADNVRRFLAFAKKKSGKDGLITYDRYGDWCVPPATLDEVVTKDSTRMTDGALLSSCYYYYICKQVGMDEEAAITRDAINRTFLKDGCYANGTVTANLLPLAMDIVPSDQRDSVMANFVRRVKGQSGEPHIDCGVIGISWIMRYLSRVGLGNVAYQIASTKTYPGWGYMVENGATTIWELWNGNTANPSMNSGNHVMMLGDLIPWTYECVAGIAPDPAKPGFKHIVMRPDFSIKDVRGARATYPSLYGDISSHWWREDQKVFWQVTIPANTTATLYLPDGKTINVGSGSYTYKVED